MALFILLVLVATILVPPSIGQDNNLLTNNKKSLSKPYDTHQYRQLRRYSVQRRNWMSTVPDDQLISHMSIPGTHDSGALIAPVPYIAWVKCQTMSISAQLHNGIRFLDIRCAARTNMLQIYHGSFDQYLSFIEVLHDCLKFLDENPTETIIMSIKQEFSDIPWYEFNQRYDNNINQFPNHKHRWYTNSTIPTLGSVRGKIVVMENVAGMAGLKSGNRCVQDKYIVATHLDIPNKWTYVKTFLNAAAETHRLNKTHLFVNFASGTGAATPYGIALAINLELRGYLKRGIVDETSPSSQNMVCYYGIVVMDFADVAVIDLLILHNKNKHVSSKPCERDTTEFSFGRYQGCDNGNFAWCRVHD